MNEWNVILFRKSHGIVEHCPNYVHKQDVPTHDRIADVEVATPLDCLPGADRRPIVGSDCDDAQRLRQPMQSRSLHVLTGDGSIQRAFHLKEMTSMYGPGHAVWDAV